MEKENIGFTIVCNWCGHNEVHVKPIDDEMCVMECQNSECLETVHIMDVK